MSNKGTDEFSQTDDVVMLLERVVLGDRQAFARFYALTSPRVYALALKMLGNAAHAQDLLQDVYLKVWYSADKFDALRGEPVAWLVSMARNRAIDLLRSKDRQSQEMRDDLDVGAMPVENDSRLGECVDRLEDQQRQSIYAAFFQGLTHSEIAARFAEPIGTIKSRVRRGLASLKECLEA